MKRFDTVELDFNDCNSIDILPMLSVIISLREFKDLGGKVNLNFNSKANQGNLLLSSLYYEGFLKLLCDLSDIVTFDNQNSSYFDLEVFATSKINYVSMGILPAIVAAINDIADVEEWVDKKLNEAYPYIEDKVPNWVLDGLINRLRIFLVESVENVLRHAYKDDSFGKYFGIYIRFREGLNIKESTEKSEDQREKIKKI
jgi:hypothetical protein